MYCEITLPFPMYVAEGQPPSYSDAIRRGEEDSWAPRFGHTELPRVFLQRITNELFLVTHVCSSQRMFLLVPHACSPTRRASLSLNPLYLKEMPGNFINI